MYVKNFESIHIDLSKKIFEVNDKPMGEGVFKLKLEFDGDWVLQLTEYIPYESTAPRHD